MLVPGNSHDPAQLIAHIQQQILPPLRAFRQQVAPLNDTHITCAQNCATALAALFTGRGSNGLPLMQGAGADALADTFGQFLDSAQQLTGSTPGELVGRLLLASQLSERRATLLEEDLTTLLQQAQSSSSVQTGSAAVAGALNLETLASGAEGAAVTLDIGATAQGGLDIPWDAVAAGASIVAVGLVIAAAVATFKQSSCTIDPWQVSELERKHLGAYSSEMDNGPDQEPIAPLPPSPKGPQNSFGKWVLILTAVLSTFLSSDTSTPPGRLPTEMLNKPFNSLSPEEQQLVIDSLQQQLQSMGAGPDCYTIDWATFFQIHGNLSVIDLFTYLKYLSQAAAILNQAQQWSIQYGAKYFEPLLAKARQLYNRLLSFFYDEALEAEFLPGWANNLRGLWFALRMTARFAQEGRLSGGEVVIRSPAGQPVTDIDILLDGNQTWAECKSMAPVTPQDGPRWQSFTRQITTILERALERKYKKVAFYFEGPINQAMRDEIEKLAREKGMPVEIFDNQDPTFSSRQRNIPMGTGWCQEPGVQQPPQATPTPTATPTPSPTPAGGQSGPPPQSSPTPTPTPTAVGTGTP